MTAKSTRATRIQKSTRTTRANKIPEQIEIEHQLKAMPRSPLQLNHVFESDTENLKIGSQQFLSMSTDTLAEEIATGLYRDPETWGWITVMSSVSDLAVSGSMPLGILISTQWKFGTTPEIQKRFFNGVNKALRKSKIALLGGDSGSAPSYSFTSTIVGQSRAKPITRMGLQDGDVVALWGSRQCGIGPCLAHRFLQSYEESKSGSVKSIVKSLKETPSAPLKDSDFRPQPHWTSLHRISRRLRAAIDTSDGVATALATLAGLNQKGFDLTFNPKTIHPRAARYCIDNKLPLELMWMFDHGDFQPLIVLSSANFKALSSEQDLIPIGKVRRESGITLNGKILKTREITECARDFDSLASLVKGLARDWS